MEYKTSNSTFTLTSWHLPSLYLHKWYILANSIFHMEQIGTQVEEGWSMTLWISVTWVTLIFLNEDSLCITTLPDTKMVTLTIHWTIFLHIISISKTNPMLHQKAFKSLSLIYLNTHIYIMCWSIINICCTIQ